VSSIRADIAALWDEAGIESEEQRRNEFAEYFTLAEDLQDSTVDVHESYYSSIRARVEELRPLLSEVSRREQIVQERIELEHIQMNPERLSARGPHAREERKREEGMHGRVKNLDKITKKVLTLIASWEEHNGAFYFAGERYADRVEEQEQNYADIRADLRSSRKKKDDKPTGGKASAAGAVKRSSSANTASKVSSSGYGQRPTTGNKENSDKLNTSGTHERELSKLVTGNTDRTSSGSDCTDATEIRDPSRALVRNY
jgi:hypothetical protein